MKRLLLIFLLLPLFAYPQAVKRHRSIIIDSVKALNGGIIDIKDSASFEKPVGIGGVLDASAILTLTDTTQGILITKLTTVQRDAVASPTVGLLIFNTTTNQLEYFADMLGWLGVGVSDLAAVLSIDNITNGSDIIVSTGDKITVDIINETTTNAGVAIEQITLENKGAYSDIIGVGGNAMIELNRYTDNDVAITSDNGGFAAGGTIWNASTEYSFWFDGIRQIRGFAGTLDIGGANEALRIGFGSGTIRIGAGALQPIGFYNVAAVTQQDQSVDLKDVFVNLGLISSSGGATPLDLDGGTLTADAINAASQITLNSTTVTDIIEASDFTGNLANSTTTADTVFAGIIQSNIAVSSIRDSLVTKCECSNVVDDGTILLPDATTQSLVVWVDGDDEWALAAIQSNGTVALPVVEGSVVNTDTDTNLCIFDSGTGATIRNRLGSSKVVCYESKYKL